MAVWCHHRSAARYFRQSLLSSRKRRGSDWRLTKSACSHRAKRRQLICGRHCSPARIPIRFEYAHHCLGDRARVGASQWPCASLLEDARHFVRLKRLKSLELHGWEPGNKPSETLHTIHTHPRVSLHANPLHTPGLAHSPHTGLACRHSKACARSEASISLPGEGRRATNHGRATMECPIGMAWPVA